MSLIAPANSSWMNADCVFGHRPLTIDMAKFRYDQTRWANRKFVGIGLQQFAISTDIRLQSIALNLALR